MEHSRPDALARLIAAGDTEALHEHLAAERPEWSWSKARRYARRLIDTAGEQQARAIAYALAPAAASDRHPGRRPAPGRARDLTGTRAAHNLDTLEAVVADV